MAQEVTQADVVCEHCGERFRYDEGRRCWTCDSLVCPACMNEPPGQLCPECRQAISALPEAIEPMLGKTGPLPESSEGWGFEFKWDGRPSFSRLQQAAYKGPRIDKPAGEVLLEEPSWRMKLSGQVR